MFALATAQQGGANDKLNWVWKANSSQVAVQLVKAIAVFRLNHLQ
jgi:hypothetical protein